MVPATTEPSTTRPFEHSQGTSQVPTSPKRIVTTTDQNALLPLLELGVRPVASAGLLADDGTQMFRRTEGFDTTGIEFIGEYGEPNAEAIAAQRPDLILGYEFDSDYYDTLAAIAPTVMIQIFDRPSTKHSSTTSTSSAEPNKPKSSAATTKPASAPSSSSWATEPHSSACRSSPQATPASSTVPIPAKRSAP